MDLFKSLPGGAQGEFYARTAVSRSVRFANNEFEGSSHSTDRAMTLRIIKDGRMSACNSSKPGSEKEMLESALEISRYGSKVGYDFPGPVQVKDIELFSDRVTQVGIREMIEVGEDLLGAVRKCVPSISASAGVGFNTVDVSLRNSNGFSGSYRKTMWHVSLGGRLIQGDDFLRIGEGRVSWTTDINYEVLKKEVMQEFEWSRTVVGFEPGTYPVIFAPSQMVFLMNPFLACLNGKSVARGISPLKEKMGQQILDPRFTLVDDGTLPFEPASAPFDREGVPTGKNVLIDRGVPSQFLLDLQTAKELGRRSTGNGFGSNPFPHHVMFMPGDTPLGDMIQGIDQGILLLGSMGAWTGNPYGGNIAGTISLGLKIENGKIRGRVKNCMFSINAFRHFKDKLRAVSKETKRIEGAMTGGGASTYPYVVLDDVVITTE